MAYKQYYIDTCIWLNLFKQEGNETKGVPLWKIAEEFLEKVMFGEGEIIYSGFILKEIQHKLNNDKLFNEKKRFLNSDPKFNFIKATEEDYTFARKLESEFNFEISFFDCLHIAICERANAILVTRDKTLIEKARKHILADKPENLLS